MLTDVFEPAIRTLQSTGVQVFAPKSFQDYLVENELPKKNTAALISIDSYESLSVSLRNNEIMVLRLGTSPTGKGTQFVLVKTDSLRTDFFLCDEEIFTESAGTTFLPTASMRDLFVYQVLPTFTETSLVNLGLASGLLSCALGLDQNKPIVNPATGQSTFTFQLKLHSSIEKIFTHLKGQVEIDAIFLGTRNGRDILFVLEAKSNTRTSLAKHKLVYPILALADRVPLDIQIVPIYLRVWQRKDGLHYNIVECELPDVRSRPVGIDELAPKKHCHLILRGLSTS